MNLMGIDIGGTKTSVCLGNEKGDIIVSRRIPTEDPERCFHTIAHLARNLLMENDMVLDQIEAIGISAPGPVSVSKALMLEPPNMPGWRNVPVVQIVQDALERPTFMNNDANACALAEYLFGSCRGVANLVYLTMSTGLGAGVIANGRLLQGVTDTAGEIGHHVLDIHGPPCPCGQRGCLELYCGGLNVANRLRDKIVSQKIKTAILESADGNPENIDFKSFLEAVRLKDSFALQMWEEYIERLAQGVGTVIMFFNPEVIIMGTIALHAGETLLEPLRAALPRYAWKPGLEACRIMPSDLGAKIGDLSALAVAITALQP